PVSAGRPFVFGYHPHGALRLARVPVFSSSSLFLGFFSLRVNSPCFFRLHLIMCCLCGESCRESGHVVLAGIYPFAAAWCTLLPQWEVRPRCCAGAFALPC